MELKPYTRKTFFYETDQMGIIHHSNYIRWFEEARFDLLEQIGYGSDFLEREKLGSPVLDVSCQYKAMTRFNEEVAIRVVVLECSKAKLTFSYQVVGTQDQVVRATGESSHCFLNEAGKIISIQRQFPALYQLLNEKI